MTRDLSSAPDLEGREFEPGVGLRAGSGACLKKCETVLADQDSHILSIL